MQLKFTLQGQRIIRTDKLRPVADSKNFLGAEFEFSHQWSGCEKTAIFKSSDGAAYSVLLNEDKCAVPYEVSGGEFYVSVFGIKDELRITSDEVTVNVEPSGYAEGETPQEPTQRVYEKILNRIAESEAAASEEAAEHSQNLENPHSVTKEQIGLGNVDNTSDLDKPVSSAVQTELDKKASISSVNSLLNSKVNVWTAGSAGSLLTVPSSNAGLKTIDYLVYKTGFLQREGDILIANNQLYRCRSVEILSGTYRYTGNYMRIATGEEVSSLSSGLEDFSIYVENSLDTKADKSEMQALQTQADNNSSNITENQRHITELYNQVDTRVHYEEFEALQTQMGDVETALDNIIEIQNTLIGGDAE